MKKTLLALLLVAACAAAEEALGIDPEPIKARLLYAQAGGR